MNNEFELYAYIHFHELNHRESINSRASVPIGIISVLLGALFYLIIDLDLYAIPNSSINENLKIAFFSFALPGIISAGIAIFHLYSGYYGFKRKYTYDHFPNLCEMQKYGEGFRSYYTENYDEFFSNGDKTIDDLIYEEIKLLSKTKFAEMADNNRDLNTRKLYHMHKAGKWLLIALLFATVSFFPYYLLKCDIKKAESKSDHKKIELELVQDRAINVETHLKRDGGNQQ